MTNWLTNLNNVVKVHKLKRGAAFLTLSSVLLKRIDE